MTIYPSSPVAALIPGQRFGPVEDVIPVVRDVKYGRIGFEQDFLAHYVGWRKIIGVLDGSLKDVNI